MKRITWIISFTVVAFTLMCLAIFVYNQSSQSEDAALLNETGEKCFYNQDYDKAVELFKQASKAGDSDAMINLGVCYESGKGVARSADKAFCLYKKAANADNPKGQLYVGLCYAEGVGCKKDETKAIYWYEKSANAGNIEACNIYGNQLLWNEPFNPEKAYYYLKYASDAKCAESSYSLAWMYANGVYVNQDPKTARQFYVKAGNEGKIISFYYIGSDYYTGGVYDGTKVGNALCDSVDYEKAKYFLELFVQKTSIRTIPKEDYKMMYDALHKLEQIYRLGLKCPPNIEIADSLKNERLKYNI